jgi:hypothetical protein
LSRKIRRVVALIVYFDDFYSAIHAPAALSSTTRSRKSFREKLSLTKLGIYDIFLLSFDLRAEYL